MPNALTGLPWRRLWRIGKPFWVSDKRNPGLLLLLGVLALLSANAGVMVFINTTAGKFMTAIEQRDVPNFYHYLMIYAIALVVATPLQVFYGYMRTRLALLWRNWLSASLFAGYFNNLAYYKLLRNQEVDNPDQRMSQDVDGFCNQSVGLFISILDSAVNVIMFVGVLWAISPLLTWTVIGYSALGSVAVIWIGKSLVSLQFQAMKREADLRFGLAEVRREAEAIAFYRGEQIAKDQAKTRLQSIIDTLISMAGVHRNIQLFVTTYNLLVPLIPAAIIAPLYFRGEVPFGNITQATMAFTVVFNGATLLIGQFGGITAYTAVINRLGTFVEALDDAGVEHLPPGEHIEISEGTTIAFNKVTVKTPDLARTLVRDLSINVPVGKGLFITGPDGTGKTAILRTIAGMWNAGSGNLTRPPSAHLMFLTQNPYLPPTTLREAICYPGTDLCPDDEDVFKVLRLVNLGDVPARAGGLDVVQNWRDFLSLSEQQRLSIARIIQNKPKYAIIDEATSALEVEAERLFYTLLSGMGATIVTAGNGPALAQYHSHVLELTGDGAWRSYPATQFRAR